MANIQVLLDDVTTCILMSKSKRTCENINNIVVWLCRLYFRLAEKEDMILESEEFVLAHYKDFWSGLVSRKLRYKYFSFSAFRQVLLEFPFLVDSFLDHIFQTAEEGQIRKAFNQFETLCLISQISIWDPDLVAGKCMEYAKVLCQFLPGLQKPMYIKTTISGLLRFVKNLTSEQKSELMKGSNLEEAIISTKHVRFCRAQTLLRVLKK